MKRLIEYTVFSGFVTAWRFATWPTSRSPVFVKPTTEGVVRPPSWFGMTTGCPPSMTATTEFVVPRSIPMILFMLLSLGSSQEVAETEIDAAFAAARPTGAHGTTALVLSMLLE